MVPGPSGSLCTVHVHLSEHYYEYNYVLCPSVVGYVLTRIDYSAIVCYIDVVVVHT